MIKFLHILSISVWTAALIAGSALADPAVGYRSHVKTGEFEEVLFELENSIIEKGLVVDRTGHLQTMLDRTRKAVEDSGKEVKPSPYRDAKYLQFCSAHLSREAFAADPMNIAICPYVVFIFELKSDPGKIHVGYRRPIAGSSEATRKALADVEALLDQIVRDAVK